VIRSVFLSVMHVSSIVFESVTEAKRESAHISLR
jgi:hypothetical protein